MDGIRFYVTLDLTPGIRSGVRPRIRGSPRVESFDNVVESGDEKSIVTTLAIYFECRYCFSTWTKGKFQTLRWRVFTRRNIFFVRRR